MAEHLIKIKVRTPEEPPRWWVIECTCGESSPLCTLADEVERWWNKHQGQQVLTGK